VIVRGPSIAITGPSAWQGLLVLDGNATVTGALHVTGVLVVLGSLDAAAAQLTVQGAVVAADTNAGGVTLGAAGAVRYDRCAVQLALAVGARPSLAPFSLWHRLSR
jgi:cytoskeletal protein CcmA (bactofilin family)